MLQLWGIFLSYSFVNFSPFSSAPSFCLEHLWILDTTPPGLALYLLPFLLLSITLSSILFLLSINDNLNFSFQQNHYFIFVNSQEFWLRSSFLKSIFFLNAISTLIPLRIFNNLKNSISLNCLFASGCFFSLVLHLCLKYCFLPLFWMSGDSQPSLLI